VHPLTLDIPEQIESERLILRRYQHGDGKLVYEAIESNLPHLQLAVDGAKQGFGFDLTTSEGCECYVRNHVAGWEARQRLVMPFFNKETQEFTGELWIECKDWDMGIHEIGYFVVASQTRKGYAVEATRAGTQFIFEQLGAHKVALTCDAENEASWRVAERAGFTREGNIRESVLRTDDSRVGTLHYGMLKSEYVVSTEPQTNR